MVTPKLLLQLLETKGERLSMLTFAGDDGQLQSIAPGALLRDLLDTPALPKVELKVVYRTGGGSMIAQRALQIKNGDAVSIIRVRIPIGDPFTARLVFDYII